MVIWIPISGFSQSFYPKKILWGNDTVVAITKPQLIKINRALNDYFHVKEVNRNLRETLSYSDSLHFYWKEVAVKTDTLYLTEGKKFEYAQSNNKLLSTSLEKERVKRRRLSASIGVGGVFLGFLLGLLLGK